MEESINVTGWTRYHADQKHFFWWGIIGLITIEATVVFGFLIGYFYLWIVNVSGGGSWPPDNLPLPPLTYPSIECGLLLICAWTMWYGGKVIQKNKTLVFTWPVIICCIAGSIILYLRWIQLSALPYDHKKNIYASYVWFLSGFHFMHLLSAILGTLVIGWLSYKGYYTEQRYLGIQVDTMYWYFVVLAWFPMFFALYLAPRFI